MTSQYRIIRGDCLEQLRHDWPDSFDLVFGSPPYEDCRSYEDSPNFHSQAWVDWMVEVVVESLRVCKGLVAFVVEGKTRDFKWSATPVMLMADLHRRGICLRKPPVFHRVGIPGNGGPDWLRNDYEFIVCCTNGGRLPWSSPTALGHTCKYPPGGRLSYRTVSGQRINASRGYQHIKHETVNSQRGIRRKDGSFYVLDKANPGNVIHRAVGGGKMGDKICHENEAPFPESLAEFFIKSFCPPGGIVLDPFCGSGTTIAVALRNGRSGVGIDIRESQCEISRTRCERVVAELSQIETESESVNG